MAGGRHGRGLRLLLLLLAAALCVQRCHGSCPVGMTNAKICSGYGKCTPQNQCVCDSRHTGFDCSQRTYTSPCSLSFVTINSTYTIDLCPLGNAWVAPAQATDMAHYPVECSNKGFCDRSNGVCHCMEGFTGTACQRSTLILALFASKHVCINALTMVSGVLRCVQRRGRVSLAQAALTGLRRGLRAHLRQHLGRRHDLRLQLPQRLSWL